ncbi:mammalian cell entry protein [Geodermatophilus sp. Leaf369]|uniref:MCE family protein n=1 Tax=Geodermatophilus sp. Leaf369 TaxID=1736354 RepID=UPI0006F738EA|nr:MCE family protein [Geodermatophilus sp. Leaf369]KQS59264.1 mammalian cell entry protein [Geodermatophilus sp. Leaf369]
MTGRLQRAVALAAAVLLVGTLGWIVLRPAGQMRVTAWFGQAVGLYEGSDVRVLGIDVGEITRVTPMGDRVRVEMLVDEDYDVPAEAVAVILAPSLVADRYVQFAPVYSGGPTMADGAEVPLERTATPVELDQVYGALDDLSVALGPTGANADGALSDLVEVGAANLDGNGQALNSTLTGFSQAVETLAENRDDLFGSVENLQVFTSALATVDAQVGQFNDNLAAVSEQLAGEREDLAAAIALLSSALGQVAGFVQQNTALLTTNVDRLSAVTLTLVQQREALAQVLDVAPAAIGNLAHAYNPDYGTLDTRDNSLGSQNADVVVCQLLGQAGRLQLAGVDLTDVTALLGLPPIDQVCARLLSGDPGGDGAIDDLNGNGVPDLQELLTAVFSPSSGLPGGGTGLPGLPSIPGVQP